MSAFSTYLEDKIIEITLRQDATWVPPTNLYLALFDENALVAELEDSDFTNEISGGDYIRKEIVFTVPTDGVTSNTADIDWPIATGTWGTITYAAVCDSSVLGNGNILYYGALSTPKLIAIDDSFSFALGDYDITVT